MTEDYRYRLLFQDFMRATSDGFIVVDRQGIVTDINKNYCDFLGKTQEEVLGKPIEEIIKNTKMYEIMDKRSRGDGPNGVYVHHYTEDNNRNKVDAYVVGNRFCFFDDNDEVIGSACQLSFKERVTAMTYSLLEQEYNYFQTGIPSVDTPGGAFDQIIGTSKQMIDLKAKALKIAKRDFSVLITGETGTGKELFAKALHMFSSRNEKPLVSILSSEKDAHGY